MPERRSVLIVAHSQGNFYANSSWHLLQSFGSFEDKVSIIGAAAPVDEIAGDGPYTSLTQDVFMNQVRRRLGALPANLSNSTSTLFGHDFVNDYLHGDKSGSKIISDIRSRIVKDYSGGVVELADSTYVHESLFPFWKYVNQIRIHSEKSLSPSQCLAIASFAKTYDWWGEACEERSLEKLELWMTKCFENEWSRKDKFDFDRCALLGDDSMGFVSVFTFDFMLAEHPECIWHESAVSQHITPAVLAEAKLLLRSSPRYR